MTTRKIKDQQINLLGLLFYFLITDYNNHNGIFIFGNNNNKRNYNIYIQDVSTVIQYRDGHVQNGMF